MKDGAGNLDFGQDDNTEETTDSESPGDSSSDDSQQDHDQSQAPETNQSGSSSKSTEETEQDDHKYPYFVRRSKVLDERDERIEAHLRKEVTDRESSFRSALADELETNNDIPKSDAREFALKFAFENPEGVAELMREEGFGELS